MAGLLDGFLGASMDDPKTMATLAMAQGLLAGPRALPAISNGLMGYGQAMQQAKQQAAAEEMRKLQLQQQRMAMEQAQAAQAKQQAIEQAYRGAMRTPQQMAMQANGGPTNAAAQAIPGMSPGVDQSALIQGLMQADPQTAYQMLQPKPRKLTSVAAGASLVDESDPSRAVFTAPAKDDSPSAIKEYNFSKEQGYGGSFLDFQLAQKKAGASNVNVPVNLGQKGFDNTLKLRGDFRSEPIYKAHQEVQSAHSQITQALKAGTPVGDLAGATKIMKLLDPASVVRESELGMAMAATGLADRALNYASRVINGNKLTPQQREEFQALADALASESAKQYTAKRAEYQGIAQRNQLNVDDVLGPELGAQKSAEKSVVRTGTLNGRKVVQYSDGTTDYAD